MGAFGVAEGIQVGLAGLGAISSFGGGKGQTINPFIDDSLYGKNIQRFLPAALRYDKIDPVLNRGFEQIAGLIDRPGRLASDVSEAIAPRLAVESSRIARDFTGTRQNVMGGLARGNAPVSIRSALDASLAAQESAAQGGARRQALMDTDALRRQDMSQVFSIIDAINSFINPRLGVASGPISQSIASQQQNRAANQAAIAGLIDAIGNINFGSKGGGNVDKNKGFDFSKLSIPLGF